VIHQQQIKTLSLINVCAGWLILLMLLSSVSHVFLTIIPVYVPGVLAWLSAFFLLPRLSKVIALQTTILIVISVSCLLFAFYRHGSFNFLTLFNYNIGLISLLAGISYLKLIALPASESTLSLPKGKKAFLSTLISAHLFSAVINLSALFLFAERIKQKNNLSKPALVLLTRAFSTAAFWSPFFAAMGVAITYAPDASLFQLVIQGVPLAIVAALVTYWQVVKVDNNVIENFQGYPVDIKSFFIPLLLVLGVFVIHTFYPNTSVVLIIAALAIFLTLIITNIRHKPKQAIAKFNGHTINALPKMSSEIILFLSAGLLSFSVATLLTTFDQPLPIVDFEYLHAILLLLIIILLSVFGLHPVISISVSGVILAPLDINHNVLGLIYLSSWSLGMIISPLSGLNVSVANHYSLSFKQIISWHYRYVIIMYMFTCLALWLLMI
jgi:hypothetical protein